MQDRDELTSMINVLAQLRKEGYTEDYKITEDGNMCTINGQEIFEPEQVRIVNFYRFEGESNPDDMAILYVIETTTGHKGTISDAYGTYSDDTVENFMKKIKSLGKDIDRNSI
ncbi:hypothetical protein [Pontibacter cellulosilyticus]|uniref:Phosphoribosylpyrophosphate synthetase n=1 Tax=Pontibacter cellulosilyticus TaxID=1720253 RepID=A0A923N510_9BACT|nr:hypothetical protein [Pontibacter cellulosilyticus]MBC5992284.1 hypothetical protein [Pontibacter cellulosilyticus]